MLVENPIRGLWNRILQQISRIAPGATSLRVVLNRWRGVRIGKGVWIGYDAIIETAYPELVEIHDRAAISIGVIIIAHFREVRGVVIGEGANIGPGAIIMPGVRIGRGSVVAAGSVVTRSVPDWTMVQGNPARPIARVGKPMTIDVSMREFLAHLKPIQPRGSQPETGQISQREY